MPADLEADALEYVPIAGSLELAVRASIDRLTTSWARSPAASLEVAVACSTLTTRG